ncbi:MAG: hypothetical protein QXZ59_04130, partial [Nitrososphaeria archaeon]
MEFSYKVSKKLRRIDESNLKRDQLIATIWNSVMDVLVEYKSTWTLENMYLIKMGNIDARRQAIQNVEYLGIPKLQASILIDDKIRELLFYQILNKRKEYVGRIIDEFVRGRPLYPLVQVELERIIEDKENGRRPRWYSLLYSLMIDAKILDLRQGSGSRLF